MTRESEINESHYSVHEGEDRIAFQKLRIADLERTGRNAEDAKELVQLFEANVSLLAD